MFNEENIFLNQNLKTKDEALAFISKEAKRLNITDDCEALDQDFHDREKEFSTGLQDGFAIPHARTDHVKKVSIMFVRNNTGIEWQTLDEKPIKYIFALLVPANEVGNVHLKMISTLATCLLEDDFRDYVKSEDDKAKLVNYITSHMEEEN